MKKIGTISKTKETILENNFHIKKKYGQNFLIDQNILRKISEIPSIDKNTLVVEIGPGLGSLTEFLLESSKYVLAYEIDPDLVSILKNTIKDDNLIVICDDFLNRNLDEDIDNLKLEYSKVIVVANLPYYITTPIVLKVIEESKLVKEIVVMTQYEVAKRLSSKPSTKDYNSLSVAIQYRAIPTISMKVPRNVFIPAPNVDSAVIKLEIIEDIINKPVSEEHFYNLVRSSFTQRRKTLVNNLHSRFGEDKTILILYLEDLGINPLVRAENLEVSDFIKLSDYLLQKNIK